MKKTRLQEFTKLMTVMKEYYGSISQETQEIYWQGLRNYDMSVLWQAFFNHIQSPEQGRFRPLVAHFLYQIQEPVKKCAEIAWFTVIKTIQILGAYESVQFEDPIIANVILDLCGWSKLCHLTSSNLALMKSDFIKLYRFYANDREFTPISHFRGIFEQRNQKIKHSDIQIIATNISNIKKSSIPTIYCIEKII